MYTAIVGDAYNIANNHVKGNQANGGSAAITSVGTDENGEPIYVNPYWLDEVTVKAPDLRVAKAARAREGYDGLRNFALAVPAIAGAGAIASTLPSVNPQVIRNIGKWLHRGGSELWDDAKKNPADYFALGASTVGSNLDNSERSTDASPYHYGTIGADIAGGIFDFIDDASTNSRRMRNIASKIPYINKIAPILNAAGTGLEFVGDIKAHDGLSVEAVNDAITNVFLDRIMRRTKAGASIPASLGKTVGKQAVRGLFNYGETDYGETNN